MDRNNHRLTTEQQALTLAEVTGGPWPMPSESYRAFIIHGIRDYGDWQFALKDHLFKAHSIESDLFGYEKFRIQRFLFAELFEDAILNRLSADLRAACEGKKVTVICHSYGSHLLGKVLQKNPDIVIYGAITCGAICNPSNGLDEAYLRGQISSHVWNFVGTHDPFPALGSVLTSKYFPSGTIGIKRRYVKNTFRRVGHSGFLRKTLWKRYRWHQIISGNHYTTERPTSRSRLVDFLLVLWNHRLLTASATGAAIFLAWVLYDKTFEWTCSLRSCAYSVVQDVYFRPLPGAVDHKIMSRYQFDHGRSKFPFHVDRDYKGEFVDIYTHPEGQEKSRSGALPATAQSIAVKSRSAAVLFSTQWPYLDNLDAPGKVDFRPAMKWGTYRLTIHPPEGIEVIPYDNKNFTDMAFVYELDKSGSTVLWAKQAPCVNLNSDGKTLSCDGSNVAPGHALRYCFGIKNWPGTPRLFDNYCDALLEAAKINK